MNDFAIEVSVRLTPVNCGLCGGSYAINERFRSMKEEKGGGWHCPYCKGSWGYFGETDLQKKTRLLELEQARHRNTLARLNEKELETKLLKKRVSAGVCPCCNRTFKQLSQHMKMKHPDYGIKKKIKKS